ncbi:hypothetical protein BGW38_003074 [Lunasporangiospora selenospora]|uniref:Uncharacterized protein n=1 Tax=Lunasporangiospora selenospora TaxID=979761 RepID=A0A9P6FSB7_9FUNG|nr:hypothetical protein BGW38_003074 [Lunasporangiospora selenospora]
MTLAPSSPPSPSSSSVVPLLLPAASPFSLLSPPPSPPAGAVAAVTGNVEENNGSCCNNNAHCSSKDLAKEGTNRTLDAVLGSDATSIHHGDHSAMKAPSLCRLYVLKDVTAIQRLAAAARKQVGLQQQQMRPQQPCLEYDHSSGSGGSRAMDSPQLDPHRDLDPGLLLLQVTRFGTVDHAFSIAQFPADPTHIPSPPQTPVRVSHENDHGLNGWVHDFPLVEATVNTSVMSHVHPDDLRVLCRGMNAVCKEQSALFCVRWRKRVPSKSSKNKNALAMKNEEHLERDLASTTAVEMVEPPLKTIEFKGGLYEEWVDPTAQGNGAVGSISAIPDMIRHCTLSTSRRQQRRASAVFLAPEHEVDAQEERYTWTEELEEACPEGRADQMTACLMDQSARRRYNPRLENYRVAQCAQDSVEKKATVTCSESAAQETSQETQQSLKVPPPRQQTPGQQLKTRSKRMGAEEGLRMTPKWSNVSALTSLTSTSSTGKTTTTGGRSHAGRKKVEGGAKKSRVTHPTTDPCGNNGMAVATMTTATMTAATIRDPNARSLGELVRTSFMPTVLSFSSLSLPLSQSNPASTDTGASSSSNMSISSTSTTSLTIEQSTSLAMSTAQRHQHPHYQHHGPLTVFMTIALDAWKQWIQTVHAAAVTLPSAIVEHTMLIEELSGLDETCLGPQEAHGDINLHSMDVDVPETSDTADTDTDTLSGQSNSPRMDLIEISGTESSALAKQKNTLTGLHRAHKLLEQRYPSLERHLVRRFLFARDGWLGQRIRGRLEQRLDLVADQVVDWWEYLDSGARVASQSPLVQPEGATIAEQQ